MEQPKNSFPATDRINVSKMISTDEILDSSSYDFSSIITNDSAFRIVYGSSSTKEKVSSREEKAKLRKEEIKSSFKAIRASECVDLLFVIDCTGSMKRYIEKIKNDIKELYEVLKSKHLYLDMTFGFIRYTDFDMGSSKYSVLNLTRSTKEFKDFISAIEASGGGDTPEDMFGGMNLIKTIPWRKDSTRVVIHLADAPCHGSEYHSPTINDSHPEGDPNGITLDSLLLSIFKLNINYYFGHVNFINTRKMVDIFDKRIKQLSDNKSCINSFDSKEIKDLNEKIFKSIEFSISTNKTQLTNSKTKEEVKSYTIDTGIPIYENLEFISMIKTKFRMPGSINKCLDLDYEMKIQESLVSIKMAPNPFAQGANRLTHYGMNGDGKKIVLKQSKFIGKRINSKKRFFELMECQTVASKFAHKFNAIRKSRDINFTVSHVLQFRDSELPIYLSVEPYIEGTYEKYNSNNGWLKYGDSFSDIIQTFSHWTYHISKGKAIVVDIQGVKTIKDSKTSFILTDPAIHTEDILRFGSTNLGKPGIIKFFQTHICNIHCEELKLKKPDF